MSAAREERQQRLSEALRQNLKRRKAATRKMASEKNDKIKHAAAPGRADGSPTPQLAS